MKKITFLLFFVSIFTFAQVGIGTTTPNPKSMLDVSSTTDNFTYRGFMPPKVPTNTERDAIGPRAEDVGLLVYVENTGCLQMWNGSGWQNVICGTNTSPEIWFNEIHYDNTGADQNEGFEIAGPDGTNLSEYEVYIYNGSTQQTLGSPIALSGIINGNGSGYGAIGFRPFTLQNDTEGLALVEKSTNRVIQFLSYEGSFTALNGPAVGTASLDIGVAENDATAITESLQLQGTGNSYSDFTWAANVEETFGIENNGQTFQN